MGDDRRHGQVKRRRLGFFKNRGGASAVEFALVAPIFFALTFSILEAGYFFFVSSAVDAANARAARLIRTGQAQGGAISRDAFFDEICNVVSKFGDCSQKLTVDVARFSSFTELAADTAAPVCRNTDGTVDNEPPYATGAKRDIVRVRICYLYNNLTPGVGLNLEAAGGGARKMISTSIFRNEPFES